MVDLVGQDVAELELDAPAAQVEVALLSRNRLAGLGFLSRLPGLRVLHVDDCGLTDHMLTSLADVPHLRVLIARGNRLQTPVLPEGAEIVDVSLNPLRDVRFSSSDQILTSRFCFSGFPASRALLRLYCPALQPGGVLNDLEVKIDISGNFLRLGVARTRDVPVRAPVSLRVVAVLPGFETRCLFSREVAPSQLLRFQFPLQQVTAEAFSYAYETDPAPESPELSRLKLSREERAREGPRLGAVVLGQNGRQIALAFDASAGRALGFGEFCEQLESLEFQADGKNSRLESKSYQKSQSDTRKSRKAAVPLDLDPDAGISLPARIQVNQRVTVPGTGPGWTTTWFYTELTEMELEE